jgi:hypothetical protein
VLIEILRDRSLVDPTVEIHEYERTHHWYDRLRLGVPYWMDVVGAKIEMMEGTPADERLNIIVVILCEPDAGEPVDIVFERTEISGGVLGVWASVIRPVVVRLFSDRSKDSPFRRDCRCHTSILGVDQVAGGRFEYRLWDRLSRRGLARLR